MPEGGRDPKGSLCWSPSERGAHCSEELQLVGRLTWEYSMEDGLLREGPRLQQEKEEEEEVSTKLFCLAGEVKFGILDQVGGKNKRGENPVYILNCDRMTEEMCAHKPIAESRPSEHLVDLQNPDSLNF
ncbi:hypothetical protein DUI87_30318 [Hirundo rustica rustica]|uniref:Uncharacterized protein n=1 Tax=Hirundo rustica rustica TaxID=333673 RepID=A0A3M0JEP8_HIRRU|nr:hypothetical protein DUI87_30318 [Hirundo rustica rustica]